jgi:hypothetical protein
MAPTPSCVVQPALYNLSKRGTKNAKVFPEPVLAAPRMSLPANACGIEADWMAVMLVYALNSSPWSVDCERGKDPKATTEFFVDGIVPGAGVSDAMRALRAETSSCGDIFMLLFRFGMMSNRLWF